MFAIKAANTLDAFTGEGLEVLLDASGTYIRAEFVNGNLKQVFPKPEFNNEPTIILEQIEEVA